MSSYKYSTDIRVVLNDVYDGPNKYALALIIDELSKHIVTLEVSQSRSVKMVITAIQNALNHLKAEPPITCITDKAKIFSSNQFKLFISQQGIRHQTHLHNFEMEASLTIH